MTGRVRELGSSAARRRRIGFQVFGSDGTHRCSAPAGCGAFGEVSVRGFFWLRLAANPSLLLLDEPFEAWTRRLRPSDPLVPWLAGEGITILMSTR